MNSWINTFHNTKANSRLNEQDVIDINYEIFTRKIEKNHKRYRQLKSLTSKLCGCFGCKCSAFNTIEK